VPSVSSKFVSSDIVLVDVRHQQHLSHGRDHGGRSGYLVNRSLQIREIPRQHLSVYKTCLSTPLFPCVRHVGHRADEVEIRADLGHYHQLGGRLQPILETIRRLHNLGFWLEIVALVISGFNDSESESTGLAQFIASVSPDIPWHVTAFHKGYRMTDPDDTSPRTLMRAAEIGRSAGLHYVYAGNLPGKVGDLENTRCPDCPLNCLSRVL